MFASQIQNGTAIHIEHRQSVYSVVLYNGDSTTLDQIIQVTFYSIKAFNFVLFYPFSIQIFSFI